MFSLFRIAYFKEVHCFDLILEIFFECGTSYCKLINFH